MTVKSLIASFTQQEDLNFLLTNRIPRAALTRFMGAFSKLENPLVRDVSIGLWKLFSDLDLSEAKQTHFKSLHDCFTRELKPGLRPFDPDPRVVASPSDAIVGAHGTIRDGEEFNGRAIAYLLLVLFLLLLFMVYGGIATQGAVKMQSLESRGWACRAGATGKSRRCRRACRRKCSLPPRSSASRRS